MPTYEHECLPNAHRFEVKQSFSDDALTECVECGEPVRKVFSAAGLVFKGSGYYVNDSRTKGKKPTTAGDSSTSGAKDASSSGGSTSSSSSGDSGGSSSSSTSDSAKASSSSSTASD